MTTWGLSAINKPNAPYGKAARNERIKLRATYLNNIAVGVYVGGVLIPTAALIAKMVVATMERPPNASDFKALLAVFGAWVFAIVFAELFQTRASNLLRDLED